MTQISAIDRLRSLRVANVMNQHVVTVSAHQALAEVAQTFVKRHVSAAPVIDESGRCVGILSATDFLKRDCGEKRPIGAREHQLVGGDDRPFEIEACGPEMACAYMTQAVQSISPDAPLLKAALVMCAEHIHRLPVLDDRNQVVGMISTMDIVAALVNAVDEMDLTLLKELAD